MPHEPNESNEFCWLFCIMELNALYYSRVALTSVEGNQSEQACTSQRRNLCSWVVLSQYYGQITKTAFAVKYLYQPSLIYRYKYQVQ